MLTLQNSTQATVLLYIEQIICEETAYKATQLGMSEEVDLINKENLLKAIAMLIRWPSRYSPLCDPLEAVLNQLIILLWSEGECTAWPPTSFLSYYQSNQLPRLLHIARLHTRCRLASEKRNPRVIRHSI